VDFDMTTIWWWQKLRRDWQWIKSCISYGEVQSEEVKRGRG
jgi:hypothetical protein